MGGNDMRAIDDVVKLRCNCGYGSISGTALFEHGVGPEAAVPIAALREKGKPFAYDYTVRLPDGYLLSIDEKDIAS